MLLKISPVRHQLDIDLLQRRFAHGEIHQRPIAGAEHAGVPALTQADGNAIQYKR